MIRFFLFPLLILTLLSGGLTGQSIETKKSRKRAVATVERALKLREKDPAEAIRILNEVVNRKTKAEELAEAFVLLGDLYVDINQPELALGRYGQAGSILPESGDARGRLLLKLGNALLATGDLPAARTQFEQCLAISEDGSAIDAACREGLADLEAKLNNIAVSQSYYGEALEVLPDSLSQSRINAKQANNYVRLNDLSNANSSLNRAIEQAPRNQPLPKAESEELLAANANVRGAILTDAPDLDKAIVDVLPSAPAELVVSDEFARFTALRKIGDIRLAEKSLSNTLDRIDEETPAKLATEVLAAGAEFYLEQEETALAADVYRSYTDANNQLLAEQRAEIDRQVAVLREQQSVDLSLKDIQAAAVEGELRARQMNLRLWLNYLLGALLLGALASVFIILRNARRRRRTNQELLLRNLQTRMNPHFIFNSLNSINNYIARQDERAANRYLGRFAKLMRRVLDQSGKDFVPLAEELEQLELYLELEKERFGEQFDYQLDVVDNLPGGPESIDLPPMILQPFVENAIWHGLRYREEGGKLTVAVVMENNRTVVSIRDNGIGRTKSAALKTENQRRHRSSGVATSRQRLELVNEHYGRDFRLEIADAEPGEENVGTQVKIYL